MRIDVRKSQKETTESFSFKKKQVMKALRPSNVPDYMKERHFATWGWFEDNILKSFFELTTGGGTKLQEIRSSTAETIVILQENTVQVDNPCVSTQYLYSLGLDHTILPGKHHPILEKRI